MSFNYAREEKKWRLWKEAEEKQMRELGSMRIPSKISVFTIRAVFNSNRRYY